MTPSSPWLGRLGNLNVSRSESRGPAPHKPLLLLTVMDQIEAGEVGPNGLVHYDVRLVSRFRDYWELVLDRQRNAPDMHIRAWCDQKSGEVRRVNAEERNCGAPRWTDVRVAGIRLSDCEIMVII